MSETIKTLMDGDVKALNNLLRLVRWQREHDDDDTIREEWIREGRLGDNVEAMAWGRRYELESIRQYELSRGVDVIRPGFTVHPRYDLVGSSTDFIETADGEVPGLAMYACEIKCPFNSKYHLQYLQHGMPPMYHHQTQGHMEVHGLDDGKFVSYDPRHPIERDKIYVQILVRDTAWTALFRERVEEFTDHVYRDTEFRSRVPDVKDGLPTLF